MVILFIFVVLSNTDALPTIDTYCSTYCDGKDTDCKCFKVPPNIGKGIDITGTNFDINHFQDLSDDWRLKQMNIRTFTALCVKEIDKDPRCGQKAALNIDQSTDMFHHLQMLFAIQPKDKIDSNKLTYISTAFIWKFPNIKFLIILNEGKSSYLKSLEPVCRSYSTNKNLKRISYRGMHNVTIVFYQIWKYLTSLNRTIHI